MFPHPCIRRKGRHPSYFPLYIPIYFLFIYLLNILSFSINQFNQVFYYQNYLRRAIFVHDESFAMVRRNLGNYCSQSDPQANEDPAILNMINTFEPVSELIVQISGKRLIQGSYFCHFRNGKSSIKHYY